MEMHLTAGAGVQHDRDVTLGLFDLALICSIKTFMYSYLHKKRQHLNEVAFLFICLPFVTPSSA